MAAHKHVLGECFQSAAKCDAQMCLIDCAA